MLKYPEITTNLTFIYISTLPLEFRNGTERKDKARKRFEDMRNGVQDNDYNRIEDGAHRDNFESNRLRRHEVLSSCQREVPND